MYVHAYTLYGSIRPFGVSCLLGSYDETEGPELFVIDPSGVSFVSYVLNISVGNPVYPAQVMRCLVGIIMFDFDYNTVKGKA